MKKQNMSRSIWPAPQDLARRGFVCHFASICAGCLLVTSFSSAIASQAAPQAPFATVMASATSCYSGAWADAETFASGVISENASGVNDEAARKNAMQYYESLFRTYECQWFDYPVDQYQVRGFFAKPKDSGDERLPVVIYNRGGNADTGALPMRFIVGKLFPVVKEGFVVVGSMYRGARLDDQPDPDRLADEFGGKDVDDVLALLPIIDAMPFANGKVGIWGTSRGGMMAYLAVRRSDRFLAMVAESAPTDLPSELEFRPEMEQVMAEWIPNYAEDRDSALRERSVVYWADELAPGTSILILHGTADQRVSPGSALRIASRLQELDRPYRLVMFENGGHGLHRTHQDEVTREVVEWFRRKLVGDRESGNH